jgi:hypothetical protein
MPGSEREQQFLKAEHLVELRSGELKKELRLGDLVLSQVLYITGLQVDRNGGQAARYTVGHRGGPFEPGDAARRGLYQWAKLRLGDLAGFTAS